MTKEHTLLEAPACALSALSTVTLRCKGMHDIWRQSYHIILKESIVVPTLYTPMFSSNNTVFLLKTHSSLSDNPTLTEQSLVHRHRNTHYGVTSNTNPAVSPVGVKIARSGFQESWPGRDKTIYCSSDQRHTVQRHNMSALLQLRQRPKPRAQKFNAERDIKTQAGQTS